MIPFGVITLKPWGQLQQVAATIKRENALFLYSISSIALKVITLLSSIMILRWISPADMGIWQTLLLIQSYGDVVRLGILRGLNRELPFLLGQEKPALAYAMAATAQFYTLGVALLGALAYLGFFATGNFASSEWRIGLLCMAVTWFAGSYSTYLQAIFRAKTEFQRLALVQLGEAFFQLVTLYLVFRLGFAGMAYRTAFVAIIVTFMLFRIRPIRVKPDFSWSTFLLLLRTGLPLYVSGYLLTLAMGFDRVILLQFGNLTSVGLYAPVAAVITAMETLPQTLVAYIYPRMSFALGQHGSVDSLRNHSMFVLISSFLVNIAIAIAGWFTIPVLMETFFPEYLPALPAVQIAIITGILLSAKSGTAILYSAKAWRLLYLYVVVALVTKWIFPWYFAQIYSPLIGVAIGGMIAAAIMMIVAVAVSLRATHAAQPHPQGSNS